MSPSYGRTTRYVPSVLPLNKLHISKVKGPFFKGPFQAGDGNRTRDLVITNDALYHLSYSSAASV